MADRQAGIGSLPNVLGVARIAATPVVIWGVVTDVPGAAFAAAIVFAAAGATDFLDGVIARARDQVTPLGAFLDLAADKVLVAGTLVALVEVDLLPGWIAATILVREFVVQAVRQLAATADVVMGARRIGKVKTFLTLLGMLILVLARDAQAGGPLAPTGVGPTLVLIGGWLMVVATVVTVASGWLYLRAAGPILRGPSVT